MQEHLKTQTRISKLTDERVLSNHSHISRQSHTLGSKVSIVKGEYVTRMLPEDFEITNLGETIKKEGRADRRNQDLEEPSSVEKVDPLSVTETKLLKSKIASKEIADPMSIIGEGVGSVGGHTKSSKGESFYLSPVKNSKLVKRQSASDVKE